MKLQVTVFHNENKYKPMSTIVEIESMEYYKEHKQEVQKRALENIGHQRYLTPNEIIKSGYTKVKVREYDKEKIQEQQELQHKINLIKYYERKRQEKEQKAWQQKPFVIQ